MHSPRSTVSAAKQAFDALRGTRVKWVRYGRGPAMTAARASAELRIAAVLISYGAVAHLRCVTRSR